GLFDALGAQQCMTGTSPIFEGEKGFMKLVSVPLDLPLFGGEKGGHFMILDTYIKHYPVEYHAQTAVEAALVLREELMKPEGLQGLASISELEIGSYKVALE